MSAPLFPEGPGAVAERRHLTAVARGEAPADLLVRGATVVNVYSGELLPADVAVAGGRIAYVGREPGPPGPDTEVVDGAGRYLSPGFIEPHAHPWVLYNPVSMAEGVLPRGTTTVFCDNLFFFHLGGAAGFTRMLDALRGLPIRYRWLLRLVSQAEWDGELEAYALDRILPLLGRDDVAGTAEVTRWPLAYAGDPRLLEALAAVRAAGRRADGHTAGASYEKLNAVAAAGIQACHEAITEAQVLDRLRLGLWTVMRHSSLRPDLPDLARAVTEARVDTRRLMLTVDGPSPGFIAEGGFVDEALRQAVARGIPPVTAIQMATVNPATFYRVDDHVGGVAPGKLADLVLLPDLEAFRPERVWVGGREVARAGALGVPMPEVDWAAFGMAPRFEGGAALSDPARFRPAADGERLPVVELVANVITRGGGEAAFGPGGEISEGLLLAVLLDRGGRWAVRCFLRGFAPALAGMASTYNTTTHLLVLGRDPGAMARAAGRVVDLGGAIVVAGDGGAGGGGRGDGDLEVPLPLTGMMSTAPFAEVVAAQARLDARLKAAGFPFADLLYALLFISCDFLPGWRITPEGILDVRAGEVVRPPDPLDPPARG